MTGESGYKRMREALEQIANSSADPTSVAIAERAIRSRSQRDARARAVLDMRAEGLTLKNIGAAFGFSKEWAHQELSRRVAYLQAHPEDPQAAKLAQLPPSNRPRKRVTPDIATCITALEMRVMGMQFRQIAKSLNRPAEYRTAEHNYARSLVLRGLAHLKKNPGHPKRHLADEYQSRPDRLTRQKMAAE